MPDTMTSWRSAVRRLAAGRGLSVAGREAAAVALAVLVWQRTGSSAWVGAVLLASELGYIAGTPLAGWLADRRDRRRVMVGAELCTAAISVAFVLPLPLPALVVLVGLASLSEAPFAAASRAALPTLVPRDHLDGANASLTRWRTLGYLAGPIVGGAGAAAAARNWVSCSTASRRWCVPHSSSGWRVRPPLRQRRATTRSGRPAGRRTSDRPPPCAATHLQRLDARAGGLCDRDDGRRRSGPRERPRRDGRWTARRIVRSRRTRRRDARAARPAARRLRSAVATGLLLAAAGLAAIAVAPAFALALVGGIVAGAGDGSVASPRRAPSSERCQAQCSVGRRRHTRGCCRRPPSSPSLPLER